jgi:beta-1,4-N-acetylglucosaminyltransferase
VIPPQHPTSNPPPPPNSSLTTAIHRIAERVSQGRLDVLPPYSPPSFPVPAADRVTLFDWMVLTCYPDELAAQMRVADLGRAEAEFAAEQQQQSVGVSGSNVPAAAAPVNRQADSSMLQLD